MMIKTLPEDFLQVSPSCYAISSEYLNFNSGILFSNGKAWLIDPGLSPQEVLRIKNYTQELDCKIEAVLLTHAHWDHFLGAGAFPSVHTITHLYFPREFQRLYDGNNIALGRWFLAENIARPTWSIVPQPDEFIARARTLKIGSLEVVLLPLPGHTADQMGIYLPAEKTLWAADTLSDLEIPSISDSCEAYIRSLKKLKQYAIEHLVPGHGRPALTAGEVNQRLQQDWGYLHELRRLVKKCIRTGFPMQETKQICDSMVYPSSEENRTAHEWNVESAFAEYGGRTQDDLIGWQKEFQSPMP